MCIYSPGTLCPYLFILGPIATQSISLILSCIGCSSFRSTVVHFVPERRSTLRGLCTVGVATSTARALPATMKQFLEKAWLCRKVRPMLFWVFFGSLTAVLYILCTVEREKTTTVHGPHLPAEPRLRQEPGHGHCGWPGLLTSLRSYSLRIPNWSVKRKTSKKS